jgi:hypothetical protein
MRSMGLLFIYYLLSLSHIYRAPYMIKNYSMSLYIKNLESYETMYE